MDPVVVDGSQGEGGGQILRSALAFSVIRGVPVRVTRVRAGREVPGLKRQHLSALKVLASVFGGEMEGAMEGSTEVQFSPGRPRLDVLQADMGTAASITLVLQAVIPAVALTGSRLRLSLTGGTDVPWSPTLDYFRSVVIPGYRALGLEASLDVARRGYYPAGGGRVTADISPSSGVKAAVHTERPKVRRAMVESRCGALKVSVAERQARAAVDALSSSGIEADVDATVVESDSPGSSVAIHYTGDGALLGSDAIGARGKRAEEVGVEAARGFVSVLTSGARLDSHVADMLVPLLSLADGPSTVRVQGVTPHLESGLALAGQFASFSWSAAMDGGSVILTLTPKGR